MTDNEQMAYFAGIVDGEGCIGIYPTRARDRRYYVVKLNVSQCDPMAVDLLSARFGGRVYALDRGGNRRPAYQWFITSRMAVAALRLMLPFLLIKKQEAEVAIRFQEIRDRDGRKKVIGKRGSVAALSMEQQAEYAELMKSLKRQTYPART